MSHAFPRLRLREAGVEPFPHAFADVTPIADAKAPHAGLTDGEETDVQVRVAGRLHARPRLRR